MSGDKTVRVCISGRVQGVWFRAWTKNRAVELGLSGWVRNRRDGTVEAIFSGPAPQVDEMIAACHAGPPAARVTSMQQSAAEPPAESGFRTERSE